MSGRGPKLIAIILVAIVIAVAEHVRYLSGIVATEENCGGTVGHRIDLRHRRRNRTSGLNFPRVASPHIPNDL